MNVTTRRVPLPEAADLSREMARRLEEFLQPILQELDERTDVRLVETFAAVVVAIVRQRDRELSLLLTELGALIAGDEHAPAGVKRLWRLLSSPGYQADLVDRWLADQAEAAITRAEARDGIAFAVLDDSEIEKPAAKDLDGLSMVRSARAQRLHRAAGGPPPARPTVVPGFGWVALVVTGLSGAFTLARMHWFSPKLAEGAERQREAEWHTIAPFLLLWGQRVVWVVDRGFATAAFLGAAFARVRFLARWRSDYPLRDRTTGTVAAAGQLSKHVRSRWTAQIWHPWQRETWTVGIASLPVSLPDDDRPLWLIVARRKGKSQTLWLLTSEDASTEAAALRLLSGYTRRWQVEWAFRFEKSELGIQSVRVESWLYRDKLWRFPELVHAFLLALLLALDTPARERLLQWCHRTGKRLREAIAPLYRLRRALGAVWEKHRPTLTLDRPALSRYVPHTRFFTC
jgi:hypothetical protein